MSNKYGIKQQILCFFIPVYMKEQIRTLINFGLYLSISECVRIAVIKRVKFDLDYNNFYPKLYTENEKTAGIKKCRISAYIPKRIKEVINDLIKMNYDISLTEYYLNAIAWTLEIDFNFLKRIKNKRERKEK